MFLSVVPVFSVYAGAWKNTLDDISEEDVRSIFFRGNENKSLSGGYKDTTSSVLKADLGIHTNSARQILSYLPAMRQRRKNIQYLKPDGANAIHDALGSGGAGLSLRDRAIGLILFFTGIRGCDIAHMELADIDWEKEETRLIQQKTGSSLTLPLTDTVGNAIYDYLTMERQTACSRKGHIFLNRQQGSTIPGRGCHITFPYSGKKQTAGQAGRSLMT